MQGLSPLCPSRVCCSRSVFFFQIFSPSCSFSFKPMDVFGPPSTVTQNIRVSGEIRNKLPEILHGVIYNTEENRLPSCEVLRCFVRVLCVQWAYTLDTSAIYRAERRTVQLPCDRVHHQRNTASIEEQWSKPCFGWYCGHWYVKSPPRLNLTSVDLMLDFANEIHQDGFLPAWKGLLQSTMKKSSYKAVVKAATKTLGASEKSCLVHLQPIWLVCTLAHYLERRFPLRWLVLWRE